jgi:GT2 family glycosyltransferase
MLIRAVVVGIDHWEDLTGRFVIQLNDHNPFEVFVVDNASITPYPVPSHSVLIRLNEHVGYGSALNIGGSAHSLKNDHDWDWLLCLNNDCTCEGDVVGIISKLRTDTIYGNAWKFDYQWMTDLHLPAVVDSAYLLIPRKAWDAVGQFDPQMDAAFEEIDYGLRAIEAGFRLDVVELPITHLNLHTRRELEGYDKRWHMTSDYFYKKHFKRTEAV